AFCYFKPTCMSPSAPQREDCEEHRQAHPHRARVGLDVSVLDRPHQERHAARQSADQIDQAVHQPVGEPAHDPGSRQRPPDQRRDGSTTMPTRTAPTASTHNGTVITGGDSCGPWPPWAGSWLTPGSAEPWCAPVSLAWPCPSWP